MAEAVATWARLVQTRMRHANASTTLNVYGHLWPDRDETSRAAVDRAMATREEVSMLTFR